MPGFDLSHFAVLLAGLASFVSPCVLPLVPPYLCFLAGISMQQLSGEETFTAPAARRVFASALLFVAGFATVFVIMGATASTLGRALSDHLDVLARLAGVLIVVLGLHFLGVLRLSALYRDFRINTLARPSGYLGAYLVGLAFAFGWTPCVGPVLAAVLFVAGSEDSVLRGATLLGAYAAGIGIPFLLAALLARPFLVFMQRMRRHMQRVQQLMGLALVLTGVAFVTGSVNEFGFWLQQTFPGLARVG